MYFLMFKDSKIVIQVPVMVGINCECDKIEIPLEDGPLGMPVGV